MAERKYLGLRRSMLDAPRSASASGSYGREKKSSVSVLTKLATLVIALAICHGLVLLFSSVPTSVQHQRLEHDDGPRLLSPPPLSPPPPEPLEVIDFCAEKCRYLPEMCSKNLHRDRLSLPAPTCLHYSMSVQDDIHYNDLRRNGGRGIYGERNRATAKLVSWAGGQARERRKGQWPTPNSIRCEEVPTKNTAPMMFPEEFEFISKLMTVAKPVNYLEWGCGTSTSFYPLLASGNVIAIDGYPPWCKKVGEEPRVKCMTDEGRLHFHCPELVGADGVTKIDLLEVGKIPLSLPDADIESALDIYVNALAKSMSETNVTSFDIALVDGRFRVQCALKLLPYMNEGSVLLMHDFWARHKIYKVVLDYYYVIGYARSAVALRKKLGLSEEVERNIYKEYMKREHLSWLDVG